MKVFNGSTVCFDGIYCGMRRYTNKENFPTPLDALPHPNILRFQLVVLLFMINELYFYLCFGFYITAIQFQSSRYC